MTIQGTVNKTGLLLFFVIVTAAWTWGLSHSNTPEAAFPWMIGGALGGFAVALVTIFKKEWSPITAPIYALLEGLFLGGMSALFEKSYPGIATQAVALTFGVLFVLLLAYKTGIVRATRGFKLGVLAATGAIALVYLVNIVMTVFFHTGGIDPAKQYAVRHRHQRSDCHRCGFEPDSGFRHDRNRGKDGRAEVHGVVWRVWTNGYADLVVPGNSAAAGQDAQKPVSIS
jgi:hypothetical protein